MTKKRITLERGYEASIDEVWELWTTKDGIESWWGPEGFAVTVQELDVRVGGVMRYTMTAVAAPMIEFMKNAGMPISTPNRVTFTEVEKGKRLSFETLADFIPGVDPYAVSTTVELTANGGRVSMKLLLDAMHDETWTGRMAAGWEGQLGKLAVRLGKMSGNRA